MRKANEMTAPEMLEAIRDEAVRESRQLAGMRGTKGEFRKGSGGGRIIENTSMQPEFRKHWVHMADQPISLSTFKNFDPAVRSTAGFYTLTYLPAHDRNRIYQNRPYMIGQDMVRMRVYASGIIHLRKMGKEIPELGWMLRWCPLLKKELFDLAVQHPGIPFYFTPDWIAYADMIRDKAAKAGIDLDGKPYVAFAAPKAEQAELNAKYKLAPKKTKKDYASVLDACDNESEEQI